MWDIIKWGEKEARLREAARGRSSTEALGRVAQWVETYSVIMKDLTLNSAPM